jgi:hypothetical protein
MYNNVNLYAGINYQMRYDDITRSVDFEGTDRILEPMNTTGVNEVLTSFADFTKTFRKFRISAGVQLTYSSVENEIDERLNSNTSVNHNYDISAQTTFFKTITLEAGYNKIFNSYSGSSASGMFTTDRPNTSINVSFLKNFNLELDYVYNNYRSQDGTVGTTYDFLNANLMYRKGNSPWELTLYSNNILNTRSIRQDDFSESLISTYQYFVLPRYFLFTLKYNI